MEKRKLIIRIFVWLIIISMVGAFIIQIAYADTAIPSTPPQNITVTDIAYENEGGQNWFAKFNWGAPTYPVGATGDKTQIFYFNRVQRGTGILENDVLEFTLDGSDTSLTTTGYGIELDHGTIYEFYGISHYTYGEFEQYEFSSGKSNRVKFLTNLDFGAELISGTNEIKIVWDDVWDTDGRIDYRILISDTSGFTQPPSIPDIIGSDIGKENSRVTAASGKLEYIYANALPGREYSIKVIPLVNADVSVIPEDELPILRVKTEIILKAKKMGETTDSVRWMLFWDPIIKGAIGSTTFTKVEYKLYRYDRAGKETFFALITDKDRYEMNLTPSDVERYKYKVEAIAYKPDGSSVPFYSTVQVALVEQIPENPAAPEFVSGFPGAAPAPLLFDELLTDKSATLLWTVPYTGDGRVDTDIYYDLYLVESIEDMKTLPLTKRIGSNLSMTQINEVRDLETGRLIGYKHTLNNLKPNSIYYFVMIAKKNYLTESKEGGFMLSMPYLSEPGIKVIITRPDVETDKPLAPPSPPFRLKPGSSIDKSEITLQMEKSWTELYHLEMKKWLYVIRENDQEAISENNIYNQYNSFTYDEYLENKNLPDGTEGKMSERFVEYGDGYEVLIHCVEYDDALRIVKSIKKRDNIVYGDLSQNYILSLEKNIASVTVPNIELGVDQTFSLPVNGLDPNTTYLIWITVKNRTGLLESDPSDPLIVTTLPDFPPLVEVPVVPSDLKGIPSDTYIDLFWSYKTEYSYNINYGTVDDLEKTTDSISVSHADLKYQPWQRIGGLEADTIYYFWIQAVAPNDSGGTTVSDWSNSLVVKTEPYSPPPKPRGFGIKSSPDAVSETSIFYEWIPEETVTFILEISGTVDFKESEEFSVDGFEYQVTGLKSNYRYFARLFSYSADTGLRSEPSTVIMVVTRKGRGEYDADVPLEEIPTGEMVKIDPLAENGIWSAKIKGVNAHRLSERIRQMGKGAFYIDMTKPPPDTKIIRLELDGEVLETLSGVNESLIMKTPGFEACILPGSFLQDEYFKLKQQLGSISVRVDVRTPVYELQPESSRQFALPVTETKVYAGFNESFMPLGEFVRPIKVSLPLQNVSDIEKIQVRYYDSYKGKWGSIGNTWLSSEKIIAAYLTSSGAVAVTEPHTNKYQNILNSELKIILQNILNLYEMPSLPVKDLNPNEELTLFEGICNIMDIIPYDYGQEDVLDKALRAGILISGNNMSRNLPMRRDEAIYAVMMVYRKKTGQNFAEYADCDRSKNLFADFNNVKEPYQQAIAFAIQNGIVIGYNNILEPDRPITRGELLTIIGRALTYIGEM